MFESAFSDFSFLLIESILQQDRSRGTCQNSGKLENHEIIDLEEIIESSEDLRNQTFISRINIMFSKSIDHDYFIKTMRH
jgi:hypothetical protein